MKGSGQPGRGQTLVMIVAPTNRGLDPAAELLEAIAYLQEELAGASVEVAVLGGDSTTITQALDRAQNRSAEHQVSEVIMVSAQTIADRSFDAWCRRVVGHWIRTRKPSFPILLAPPVARQEGYLTALTEAVRSAKEPITERTAPLLSPAWEQVPGFARHVLVCRGPRCSALGAAELASSLDEALDERGLDDDDVLVKQTGCLFPCSQGPVLVVYPDNTWYAQLTPDDVPGLVDQHLVGGVPLAGRLAPRRSQSD